MRALLAAAGLIVCLAGGAGWIGWQEYGAKGPLQESRAVVVPRGGTREVAEALGRSGVIRAPWRFQLAAVLTNGDGPLKAAELELPAGASLRDVLSILRTGKPVQHRLTLAEGLTAMQVDALLDRADALDGSTPVIAEGSLLPETYAYERGMTRASMLARAARAMERTLDAAWNGRAPDLPLASPQAALVLASIVERETARGDERPLVAAVYLNRLRRGMKLQSDPTVVYGASGGSGMLDHGLTRAELDADTPYNTYRIAGLPPGPICMPGLASLQAVAHPAQTDDLFFVADGTGGHAFARTEQEHSRNVARWRAAERQRTRP